jgi:dTDP-4-amino-4,6-dideoxygalactose transaminase
MSVSAWPAYEQHEIDAVSDVLASGKVNYWTGENGKEFECEFAGYCDAKYSIALANGTLALELALEAAGIGPGCDVIVTPRTFIASASCVVRRGARPVFADISLDSQNLTPESVAAALTPNTKAVVAVHHAGWPCDMDGLMALADDHDFVVIEDCAQAHGAKYKGRPVGGLGHIAAFSFCQDKIMTTGGEGGMLVTNDEAIWKKAWSIKDHGKNYDAVFKQQQSHGFRWLHDSFGTNMRMTEMQAVIGRLQLKKLTDWNTKRGENAARIAQALSRFSALTVPLPGDDIQHAYYRLYAFVDQTSLVSGWDRDRIMLEINAFGIPCFSGSCPEVYNEMAFEGGNFRPHAPVPNAKALGPKSLAFLVHPTLTDQDLARTCDAIAKVLSAATS